jgi:hypothetical protein
MDHNAVSGVNPPVMARKLTRLLVESKDVKMSYVCSGCRALHTPLASPLAWFAACLSCEALYGEAQPSWSDRGSSVLGGGRWLFHYIVRKGLVFMCMAEEVTPRVRQGV